MEEQSYKDKQRVMERTRPEEQQVIKVQAISDGNKCPHCGTVNEAGTLYCENCGTYLKGKACPVCGASVAEGTDLCEHCKSYLSENVCSFCGAKMSEDDAFCPECGSPRRGIVCPVCHSLSMFSFCPRCGTALNEIARKQLEAFKQVPQYKEMAEAAKELENLLHVEPINSSSQMEKVKKNAELRERVLQLLDMDFKMPDRNNIKGVGLDEKSLSGLIQIKRDQLQKLLDSMELTKVDNPAIARNYAMAHKPLGSSLGWKCNYKHAIHSGPFGCACPQLGGRWVILDGKTEHKIVDDE